MRLAHKVAVRQTRRSIRHESAKIRHYGLTGNDENDSAFGMTTIFDETLIAQTLRHFKALLISNIIGFRIYSASSR